ncbi:MAG: hypothetical protein QG625_4100 [Cyanobacteriota bacterium erpe_2018_sw_39hr_WHONDRS-SW48-000098_B_bin.30]|nr:hypothetical protein [Cyanobacteriota bacterium erpe_2018_sw_39hr_WHONDRS-SW48-000098_B_bin.30]
MKAELDLSQIIREPISPAQSATNSLLKWPLVSSEVNRSKKNISHS